MRKKKSNALIYAVIAGIFLCVIGYYGWQYYERVQNRTKQTAGSEQEIKTEDKEKKKDNCIVTDCDYEKKEISLYSLFTKEDYTLKFSGASDIRNQYNEIISITQVEQGEIVAVLYSETEAKLISMNIMENSFQNREVKKFKIDRIDSVFTIGEQKYYFNQDMLVFSNGEQISVLDLNEADELTIRGIKNQIYSITVEKGHGYVKLQNEDFFVGGWIEIGQAVLQPVTRNMIVTVPEGTFDLTVVKDGNGGTKSITVEREKELVVDISGLKQQLPLGSIRFKIEPEDAVLYIENEETDYEELVVLEYGKYQISVTATGFESYKSVLNVSKTLETKEIKLVSIDGEEEENNGKNDKTVTADKEGAGQVSGNSSQTVSENTSAGQPDKTPQYQEIGKMHQVYIDSPTGAEVYYDGTYMGIVPVTFQKSKGMHILIFKKEGYEPKSYTIEVDDAVEDTKYSFPELKKEK